jgi:hypothetical protein
VSHGYGQGKGVGQLRLELGFPGITAALLLPPVSAKMSSWPETIDLEKVKAALNTVCPKCG